MKRLHFFLISIIAYQPILAQEPDDALRSAFFTQNGTARNMATGGAMGSLGGDISAANVNPAGIGLYKTREFVFTPSFNFNKNKANYRGTDTATKNNSFITGPIGFVFGGVPKYAGSWASYAFSISYNQLANYNNHIQYSGYNDYSSFTEKYLEELTRDRADTNAALSNYIFGSSLAFRTFLIDTALVNGQIGYKSLVPVSSVTNTSSGVNQTYNSDTKGGYNEVALSIAGNKKDKLYMGASLTIPIISYHRIFSYTEKDATNNPNNNFSYFTYNETFNSSGVGIGLKLGAIFKPTESWRVGLAVHTPQLINFKDEIRSSIIANTEGYAGTKSENSDNLNNGNPGVRNYNLLTPWRAIISASYVLGEVEDVKSQKGFVTADIEYVDYKAAKYSAQDQSNLGLVSYYDMVNATIKTNYKGNINMRLGGELKFDPFMVRLGAAFYGSPYADNSLKANRTIFSGGLGYRNRGIFIDMAYAYTIAQDANFPYRLNDVKNTFAVIKNNMGNLILTFGVKF